MKIGVMVKHMIPDNNQIDAICLMVWASILHLLTDIEQNLALIGFFLGLPLVVFRTLAAMEDYKKKRRENNRK